jgi:type I restriction enzyme S subunit
MSEWKEYKLGEILAQKGYIRGPFGSALKRPEMKSSGYVVYEQQHAIHNTREFRYFIDELKFNELKRFKTLPNDLIISCSGTVGEISIIQESDPKGIISQALLALRPNLELISPKFLFYFFKNRYGYNQLISASHGSVQVNIAKREVVESIKISLPNRVKQNQITEILSSLDDKIELNNKINQELENLAQTLFKRWFIDFEFPNENGEPYKSSGGEMIDSELGEIPKGWNVQRFKDIVSKYIDNRGKTPPVVKDGIPLVEVKHMVDLGIYPTLKTDKFLSKEVYDTFLRTHLLEDDILMSTVGTIGRLNIVPNFEVFAIAQNVLGVRFRKDLISQFFMFCLMRTKGFNDEIKSRLIETVQSSIKRSDLEKIPVIIPKRFLIESFDKIIKDTFDRIKNSALETEELIKLRDALLPKLISGELEVN